MSNNDIHSVKTADFTNDNDETNYYFGVPQGQKIFMRRYLMIAKKFPSALCIFYAELMSVYNMVRKLTVTGIRIVHVFVLSYTPYFHIVE